MLDFRTETFLTVCEYMNYTKAAEVLNMTQPAISGHIRYLERFYGVRLFDYEKKKLTLTKQGKRLRQALQTLASDEKKLKDEILQLSDKHVYRIGATLSIGESYLPQFLSGYLDTHKRTELSVVVANTSSLLKQLDHGELDIVLTEGFFNKNQYESRLIKEEEMAVFCGKNYNCEDIAKLEDLFLHRFISREPGSGTRAVFENFLFEKGYSIDSFSDKCDFTSLDLIIEMLAANQGISVMYKCVGRKNTVAGRIREIDLPGFSLKHDFNAVWQKNGMFGVENEKFLEELHHWTNDNELI